MKPRHKRLAIARRRASPPWASPSALVLNAFQSNLVFFYSPTQVAAKEAPHGPHLPRRRAGRGRQRQARRHRRCSSSSPTPPRPCRCATRASCPTCSRRARAWSRRASCERRRVRRPRGAGQARRELHAARSRRRAEAGAARSTRKMADTLRRGSQPMIPELGHFAALAGAGGVAGRWASCRWSARSAAAPTGWRWRGPPADVQFVLVALAFGCLTAAFVQQRLLGAVRGLQLQLARCRCTTASPPSGAATKARCCCGC